ncbi:MAG TPA: hypothetical protein VGY54_26935 [Polyangiaceae bacterium]|jgi:hypothetical protein|nr:hypothetical protein [Polyangiaceae bacterium]
MRLVTLGRNRPLWIAAGLWTCAVGCGDSPPESSGAIVSDAGCESAACGAAALAQPAEPALDAGATPHPIAAASPVDSGSAETSTCTPTGGVDVPDDHFIDRNCDGIVGDKARAVFVAPSGLDSASGTFGDPVQTIRAGVRLAARQNKDVYVCNATYSEAVELTAAVSIYGGYDCDHGWRRIDDEFVVAPSAGTSVPADAAATAVGSEAGSFGVGDSGIDGAGSDGGAATVALAAVPLVIRGVAQPVTIDRARLQSPDAISPGGSSIASLIVNSSQVTLHNVVLQAGAGADGASGDPVVAVTTPATSGADGQSGFVAWQCSMSELGANPRSACFDSSSVPTGGQSDYSLVPDCQGRGGSGGFANQAAMSGLPDGIGGLAGTQKYPESAPQPGRAGQDGNSGSAATPNAATGLSVGTFSFDGYAPTNAGSDGTAGSSGGGGGGGAADTIPICDREFQRPAWFWAAGGGGEGGYGGCGGAAGHGGGGGGASIGLLAVGSTITLSVGTVNTSAGGRGGNPSPGTTGQPGGLGGAGGQDLLGCSWDYIALSGGQHAGAPGGPGGRGGPGGPGGGGPSLGIVTVGAVTNTNAVVLNIASGGKGGTAVGGVDGPDGMSTNTFSVDSGDAAGSATGDQ